MRQAVVRLMMLAGIVAAFGTQVQAQQYHSTHRSPAAGYAAAPYYASPVVVNNFGAYGTTTTPYGTYTRSSIPSTFGYGGQGAWNALSRRNGYDPVYLPPAQPTLYYGGQAYQYPPGASYYGGY